MTFRRFLHITKTDTGEETCIWRELRHDEVTFSMDDLTIHCLYATPHPEFSPDHCQDGKVVMLNDLLG